MPRLQSDRHVGRGRRRWRRPVAMAYGNARDGRLDVGGAPVPVAGVEARPGRGARDDDDDYGCNVKKNKNKNGDEDDDTYGGIALMI